MVIALPGRGSVPSRPPGSPRPVPEHVVATGVVAAWTALIGLHSGTGPERAGPLHGLALWALMTVAMMVPPAWPAVRHVAANSLRRRRGRAVAEFLAAYVAVWVAVGAAVVPAIALASGRAPGHVLLACGLGAAAAWQLLPVQRRALRAGHRTVPLPPRGWRAAAGAARFGLKHGAACVGVCGPLMLVMAAAGHGAVGWMVVVGLASTGLRLVPPRFGLSEALATALAGAAVIVLVA